MNVVCVSPTCSEILRDRPPDFSSIWIFHGASKRRTALISSSSESKRTPSRSVYLSEVRSDLADPSCKKPPKYSKHSPHTHTCLGALARPELIREVDLGPFKHKVRSNRPDVVWLIPARDPDRFTQVDDGLPLRKFAYTVRCQACSATACWIDS